MSNTDEGEDALMVVVGMSVASAQKTANSAQLELTMEVATTKDNGSPQAPASYETE